nr:MAG TPA: hypothetical protein [Caudoviricetes sp.]
MTTAGEVRLRQNLQKPVLKGRGNSSLFSPVSF